MSNPWLLIASTQLFYPEEGIGVWPDRMGSKCASRKGKLVQIKLKHMLTKYQVEGEAQGNDEGIQKLLKDLNDGPSAAHVVKLEKSELGTKEGESSFEVRQ